MQKLLLIITLFIIFFANFKTALAIVDPRDSDNNHFGIHITDENDLNLAAELINSSGGDWGYITIVIREDNRDFNKWQAAFDRMRKLKLIPLIRLATKIEDGGWAKPREDDIDSWVDFLTKLNWVIKNRYVILFNEPNHTGEWGGEINPEEYAKVVRLFHEKLKGVSDNFFILPAGFDASAPTSSESLDMYQYFNRMYKSDPEIFSLFDGWTSHSYPNPNFSALPENIGKISIVSYKWEINYLSAFGLKRNIPIFITETGWKHNQGTNQEVGLLSTEKVADFYKSAFEKYWLDNQIVAITPFILKYLENPFINFSWIKPKLDDSYPQYKVVQNLSKIKGAPVQENNSLITSDTIPEKLVIGSKYSHKIKIQNTGQSIWNNNEFKPTIFSTLSDDNLIIGEVSETKPFETAEISLNFTTPENLGSHVVFIMLKTNGKRFGDIQTSIFQLVSPPTLQINAQLGWKTDSSTEDLKLLIYDYEDLVKEIHPFTISKGKGKVKELFDLIPNRYYRFVLINPYYLPRQETEFLSEDRTTLKFKRLLPFDINKDGSLTASDLLEAFKHPIRVIKLLSPIGKD